MYRRQKLGWIGIDISSATVKVAQLAKCGDSLSVIGQAIVPRSAPSSMEDPEAESDSLWSASGEIGAAVAIASKLRGRRAALTMPMGCCDIHHIENSGVSDDLDSLVRRAIESTTQVSADDLQFDIWPAETLENSEEPVRWNVLAVARPWSDQVYRDVVNNGFACQRIDGLPHSLARALRLGHSSPNALPVAALDWGFSQATFCIVHQGKPVYARVLKDCGLDRLIESLTSGLGIRSEDAFSLLQEYGLKGLDASSENELAQLVAELTSESLDQLKREVSRTLSYLDGARRAIKPQQVFLFGGGGLINGVTPYLSQQLKIETLLWGLEESQFSDGTIQLVSQCMFGPALAMSALAWEEQ